MSRIKMTAKNIAAGYTASIISMLLGFVSRTIFIYTLGSIYLGVNGLFTNVLGMLSLTELGIGTAMNFSLYKPVAKGDTKKIQGLMNFYKNAYRVIALVVAVLGLSLVPFLKYIIKGGEELGYNQIQIYYLIFLFNTVITYFVSYKFSLVNAHQKNYIVTNVNIVTNFITVASQIVILLLFKNFLLYLLIASFIGLTQKIFISFYLNRLFPYLKGKNKEKVPSEEFKAIKTNVASLIFHKLGDVCVSQTDNIIISSFLNVVIVGYLSNYNLIITSVTTFIMIFMNSVSASFGNMMVTENKEKVYDTYKTFRFTAFLLYGFSGLMFYFLLTPFITLWIGADKTLSSITIALIILNHYLTGMRYSLIVVKTAAGVFKQDRFILLLQAIINLVASIILVKLIGLPGVFAGTVLQSVVANIARPFIYYPIVFKKQGIEYFKDSLLFLLTLASITILGFVLKHFLLTEITWPLFILFTAIFCLLTVGILYIFSRKRKEFIFLRQLVFGNIKKSFKKFKSTGG